MKKCTIFLIVFLIAILVTSGCTRSESTGAGEPVTAVQTTPSSDVLPTSYTTPVPTPPVTYPSGIVPPELVTVSPTPTRIATDNPYLEFHEVRKKTFDYGIPNCPMRDAFPAIVNDQSYGINQPIPKITALSEDEYETFLRKYTEGKAENTPLKTLTQCQGAEGNPNWNFIETRVIINPTNVRPVDYTISLDVRSKGKIIKQFQTTKTLTIDQKVTLVNYIPLKMDEIDLFDSLGVTYTRLSN
ncbi:MAG: hypothetical protein Q8R70_03910 [Methanoregula sp.]|nr:hypothetical protein [Methanoregula sp.]